MSELPNPSGFCFCGCGQRTQRAARTDTRWNKVKGEYLRFLPGHQGWKYRGVPSDMKRCPNCKQTKPNSEFYESGPLRKHVRTGYCKVCQLELNKTRFRERLRLTRSDTHLRSKYGLTLEEYEDLHAQQAGLCAICFRPETNKHPKGGTRMLSVDHEHPTGLVRGLLCGNCNRGLGVFEDDIARLQSAIDYLLQFRALRQ